ncbi:spore germination protein [Cohnella sp. JJ-181]|uniref:spore germination protein n=1 Tax=Cohnella rhizoplanae TaxID=2974897 RepID=UPI0022FF54B9|nr:spore germination protein [Cohnella sp. JJ-181]CAI6085107.1 Spore germination protein XA [Cohnella sp. JJ-181]
MRTGHKWLDDRLRGCEDVRIERLEVGGRSATLAYTAGMIDNVVYKEQLLPALGRWLGGEDELGGIAGLARIGTESEQERERMVSTLFAGTVLLFLAGEAYAYDIASMPERSPEESSAEMSVKGPRDGFVESFHTNRTLIRRRLKTTDLKIESYTAGQDSKTDVALLYLESVADDAVVQEARKRIERISADIVLGSAQVEELLSDRSRTLFPLIGYSGRPDFAVESLLTGRVAILVDGLPLVYTAPVNLFELLKSPEDLHNSFYFVTFERFLRLLGLVVTLTLPGFWVALSAYNVDQIPFPLLSTIVVSRMGLPMSTAIEMFFMLFMFELFREAGVRLPRAVGQTVAVVGGIIVGDAAIRAGLTSPTMLVASAITNVSSFTLVNQTLLGSVSLMRFFILILSSVLGMFGFFIGSFAILLYLVSLRSFGIPYLKPAAPYEWKRAANGYLKPPTANLGNKLSPSGTKRRGAR